MFSSLKEFDEKGQNKMEYLVRFMAPNTPPQEVQKRLNAGSAAGWELVTMTLHTLLPHAALMFVFRRPHGHGGEELAHFDA